MITILAFANLICLSILSIIHLVMGWLFYRYLTSKSQALLPSDFRPRTVVILCLRGPDPFLRDTLLALLNQDYANYSIKIVIDHPDDPSWAVVEEVSRQAGEVPFEIQKLKTRSGQCGLKCGSIVQAIESLSGDEEIVALSDADVVPDRNWLSSLVAPLAQPEIGVATGNQWFSPKRGNLGSLVRNVWHAGAIIPTLLYKNPWAGSCAMRIKDIRETGLLDSWKRTIVDDGPICEMYKPHKLQIHFVPSLVIVNREECSLGYCYSYIRRMLTWSRLYERTFILTPIHMLAIVASLVVALGLQFWGLAAKNALPMVLSAVGLSLFAITLLITYLLVETAIIRVVRKRGESMERTGVIRLLQFCLVFPITILIYASVLPAAIFARRVKWRNVTYEISNRYHVSVIADIPYRKTEAKGVHSV